ncbi:MAG: hypothetical protein H7Y12_08140 [Sphingobacteriaceae bacterium]|nr:hypothetical protein [Cytophagaceae bacterium]
MKNSLISLLAALGVVLLARFVRFDFLKVDQLDFSISWDEMTDELGL